MLDYFDYKFKKKLKSINTKKQLELLDKKGFIKSVGSGDFSIGHTIEKEFGISANNYNYPDYLDGVKPIELKSRRKYSKNGKKNNSLITIFTSDFNDPSSSSKIFNQYGYNTPNNGRSLKCNISTRQYNNQGFKLFLNIDSNVLEIIHQRNGKVSEFIYSDLLKSMKKKINNLLLVKADSKKQAGIEYFNYNEAFLYSKIKKDEFTKLLQDNKIITNFRMTLKPSGLMKDHYFAFRIYEKNLDNMYKNKEQMYPTSSLK